MKLSKAEKQLMMDLIGFHYATPSAVRADDHPKMIEANEAMNARVRALEDRLSSALLHDDEAEPGPRQFSEQEVQTIKDLVAFFNKADTNTLERKEDCAPLVKPVRELEKRLDSPEAEEAETEGYKTIALSLQSRIRDIHTAICGEANLSPREQHEAIMAKVQEGFTRASGRPRPQSTTVDDTIGDMLTNYAESALGAKQSIGKYPRPKSKSGALKALKELERQYEDFARGVARTMDALLEALRLEDQYLVWRQRSPELGSDYYAVRAGIRGYGAEGYSWMPILVDGEMYALIRKAHKNSTAYEVVLD